MNGMFGGTIMASIIDKFLNSMKLYDDDELDEEEGFEEGPEEEEEMVIPERPERPERPVRPARAAARPAYEEEEAEPVRPVRSNVARRSSVVNMRPSTRAVMEVSMVRPTSMEDAREVCDRLLGGRVVVINMEGVQVDLAQRIIDFASGACYSIDGNLQKISSYIFIVTPSQIELSGDFQTLLNAAGGSGKTR